MKNPEQHVRDFLCLFCTSALQVARMRDAMYGCYFGYAQHYKHGADSNRDDEAAAVTGICRIYAEYTEADKHQYTAQVYMHTGNDHPHTCKQYVAHEVVGQISEKLRTQCSTDGAQ